MKKYVSKSPTDELIAEIEEELGYEFPANTCFSSEMPTCWAENHVEISGIFGIDRDKTYSLCGELGSKFWIDEWEYSPIGVAICETLTGSHNMLLLVHEILGCFRNNGVGYDCEILLNVEEKVQQR